MHIAEQIIEQLENAKSQSPEDRAMLARFVTMLPFFRRDILKKPMPGHEVMVKFISGLTDADMERFQKELAKEILHYRVNLPQEDIVRFARMQRAA